MALSTIQRGGRLQGMKRLLRTLRLGALIAVSNTALAWPEPETVLGIPLGATLAAVRACTPKEAAIMLSDSLCVEASQHRVKRVLGSADLGLSTYATDVLEHEGRVLAVTRTIGHTDWLKLKAVLVERFGQPTSSETGSVVTGGGARLSSETLLWKGQRVEIVASERLGRIDRSSVTFADVALMERQNLQDRKSIKEGAKRL
jgi:hypothetical protein